MTQLEKDFDSRVRSAIQECRLLGYHPNDFAAMLEEASSAVNLAIKLVTSGEIQTGLKRIASLGRPDLAIESIMLEPKFQSLFQQPVLDAARWRLAQV